MNEVQAARPIRTRIAWGAIFAGALFSLAVLLLLGSLIAMIQLSQWLIIGEGALPIVALGIAVVALFCGGFATVRLEIGETLGEALFHGIMVWSLAACFLIFLGMNGFFVFGASAILGQPVDPFQDFMTASAAFWASAGVALSLAASLLGCFFGWRRRVAERVSEETARPSEARDGGGLEGMAHTS